MIDLREQLLKAGLVSAEQASKAEREQPSPAQPPRPQRTAQAEPGPRRDGGGDRREGGRGERRDGSERRDGGERRGREGRGGQAGPAGVVSVSREALRARDAEALGVARGGKVEGRTAGHRRWYWQARGAGLPFLEVNEETHGRLERGEVAVVESPRGEAWLVEAEAARKLAELDPSWIRLWNARA
jgi:hypothetical protein